MSDLIKNKQLAESVNILVNRYLGPYKNIHTITDGDEYINGNRTGKRCIVVGVEKKLDVNNVPKEQLLPRSIQFQGENIKVDVQELYPIKKYDGNHTAGDFQIPWQGNFEPIATYRPIHGGMSISTNWGAGTLGLMVRDSFDGSICALTNNHVTGDIISWSTSREFMNSFHITIPIYQKEYTTRIGCPKRIYPIYCGYDYNDTYEDAYDLVNRNPRGLTGYVNKIDAALIHINSDVSSYTGILNNNDDSGPYQFASTQELDNIPIGTRIYSCGRTTGRKGWEGNEMYIKSLNYNVLIDYGGGWFAHSQYAVLTNCMSFGNYSSTYYALFSGDSGSVVTYKPYGNNTHKIIGLAFAGNASPVFNPPPNAIGIFCRIDNVSQQLGISAWDGNPGPTITFPRSRANSILLPTNYPYVIKNGKKYVNSGYTWSNPKKAGIPVGNLSEFTESFT